MKSGGNVSAAYLEGFKMLKAEEGNIEGIEDLGARLAYFERLQRNSTEDPEVDREYARGAADALMEIKEKISFQMPGGLKNLKAYVNPEKLYGRES